MQLHIHLKFICVSDLFLVQIELLILALSFMLNCFSLDTKLILLEIELKV